MILYLVQFGWLLFSILAGPEEAAWSYPFRNLNFDQFDKDTRAKESKAAHRFGWWSVAIIGVLLSATTTLAELSKFNILYAAILAVIFMCEYSIAFDGSFGQSIGKGIFFIGSTAETDNRLGSTKGKLKFFICLGIIIALNVVLKIFF